ncbi:MAG: hypothetical protein QG614_341 [Patescibacteria group bacterium]|nr:hypothetical protein [Patescibacteria group bacterium]
MKDAIFMGINFQQFADLNSIGIFLLFLFTIKIIVLFNLKKYKHYFKQISYDDYMWGIILILIISIVGANMYAYIWGDYPCELCWYQRVLIYPMLILAASELYFKTRVAHKFIAVLSVMTFLLASYHYYNHFMKYVLGKAVIMPCSQASGLPNCADAIVSYGFVTMPLMSAVVAFFLITVMVIINKVYGKRID